MHAAYTSHTNMSQFLSNAEPTQIDPRYENIVSMLLNTSLIARNVELIRDPVAPMTNKAPKTDVHISAVHRSLLSSGSALQAFTIRSTAR